MTSHNLRSAILDYKRSFVCALTYHDVLPSMVNFCAIYGCGNRGDRDRTKSFYRLPAVITRQCKKTEELSSSRRTKWLALIKRDIKPSNLPYVRVCSDHFITGKLHFLRMYFFFFLNFINLCTRMEKYYVSTESAVFNLVSRQNLFSQSVYSQYTVELFLSKIKFHIVTF